MTDTGPSAELLPTQICEMLEHLGYEPSDDLIRLVKFVESVMVMRLRRTPPAPSREVPQVCACDEWLTDGSHLDGCPVDRASREESARPSLYIPSSGPDANTYDGQPAAAQGWTATQRWTEGRLWRLARIAERNLDEEAGEDIADALHDFSDLLREREREDGK